MRAPRGNHTRERLPSAFASQPCLSFVADVIKIGQYLRDQKLLSRFVGSASSRFSKMKFTKQSLLPSYLSMVRKWQLRHQVIIFCEFISSMSIVLILGGKDSTVLAHVLKILNDKYKYGLDLFLLSVDEVTNWLVFHLYPCLFVFIKFSGNYWISR